MKSIIHIFLILTLPFLTIAQGDLPLEGSGKIPAEFLTPSSKKYGPELKKKATAGSKTDRQLEKNKNLFNVQSHFSIDRVLKSGKVLFNDPIGQYVNKVLQKVIAANPDFKKPAQVYILRSTAVNAFATDRGTIFVTLGLLAQLENEAQLAFILSHELVHVEKRHALDLYIETKTLDRKKSINRNQYKDFNLDEKLIKRNQYSQGLEKEADGEGLKYFLNTGYASNDLDQVFDVLQYSYLPFELIPLDSAFFNDSYFHLPAYIWQKKLDPIVNRDEDIGFTSTHPGSEERKNLLLKSLEESSNKDGAAYLISETEFNTVRNLARQELPDLYLHAGNFPDAAYNAYLLQKSGQQDMRSEKAMLKAFYLYAKVKNEELINEEIPSVKDIQGEPQRMHHLMDTLNAKELTILSLKYGWKLKSKYKDDQEINTIVKDLFTELGRHVKTLDEFKEVTGQIEEKVETPKQVVQEAPKKKKSSKLNKIKEQVEQNKSLTGESAQAYWRGAFVLEKADSSFQRYFKDGLTNWKKREEWQEYAKSTKGKIELASASNKKETQGYYMGIKKIVIVNPAYLRINANGKVEEALFKTEVGQKTLHDLVKEVSKQVKIEPKILDVHQLKSEQTVEFNELRYLNDWFGEQVQYSNLSITPGVHQVKIDAIAKKYGTDYFMWTGVLSMRNKGSVAGNIGLSLFTLPFAPFVFHRATMMQYSTYIFAMVCNVRTGEMTLIKDQAFYGKDSEAMLKKHYYDVLNQVVTKPKKK